VGEWAGGARREANGVPNTESAEVAERIEQEPNGRRLSDTPNLHYDCISELTTSYNSDTGLCIRTNSHGIVASCRGG